MISRSMRKHAEYYYVRPHDVDGETLVLRDDEVTHLVKVCRKQIGDSFYAVDGEGGCYQCKLMNVGDGRATAAIEATQPRRSSTKRVDSRPVASPRFASASAVIVLR